MRFTIIILALFISFSLPGLVQAAPFSARWTGADDTNAEFLHLVQVLNQRSGLHLSESDFMLIEDRELANNHFKMFVQAAAGIPINNRSFRVWTDLRTGALIQAEAFVESETQIRLMTTKSFSVAWPAFSQENPAVTRGQLRAEALNLIKEHSDDPQVREINAKVTWEDGSEVYVLRAKAKHGIHTIKFLLDTQSLIENTYKPFEESDANRSMAKEDSANEFSLPALVYPIYEEASNNLMQNRVVSQLKHLKRTIKSSGTDAYAGLRVRRYLSDKNDSVLGLTPEGQADGYWAMADIKAKAKIIYNHLPDISNSFNNGGVILEGRYATVNIHPDAVKQFTGIQFAPQMSSIFQPAWAPVSGDESGVWEMIPGSTYLGKPLTYFEEAYQRPARRLPDHNPVQYLNDGFDEVQVYYAVDTLMVALHDVGFTDPDFSTRPFHAFLYDPNIMARDNAYYTDDTINFSTYSAEAQNYARDNSTIWHELGHGIMDRLMGDSVHLADTGGLSEGMADFVAEIVLQKVTKGQPFDGSDEFRIVNSTGFSLTNEVHDDGEAYGGSMRDLLVLARNRYGLEAVKKVGDLTMETMRLCRNHPGITADVWFNHMLFADQLGHLPTRAPGELSDLIRQALASRNFTFDGKGQAQFKLMYGELEMNDHDKGSRQNPIRVVLPADQKATYTLQVSVTDGDAYKFHYPIRVRVQLKRGPLQGAIQWDGEENVFVESVLNSPGDIATLNLTINGTCDYPNRDDGSCVDFAYIQLWPEGATSPVAKKRFYLRLTTAKP
ncbi:MAG: hypothetical protein H7061_11885 [Bdellovibrionaceae bacterium]|nr:hypothetical protein [Bdellovibrio sp.]